MCVCEVTATYIRLFKRFISTGKLADSPRDQVGFTLDGRVRIINPPRLHPRTHPHLHKSFNLIRHSVRAKRMMTANGRGGGKMAATAFVKGDDGKHPLRDVRVMGMH